MFLLEFTNLFGWQIQKRSKFSDLEIFHRGMAYSANSESKFDPWENRSHKNTPITDTRFWVHWAKIHAYRGKLYTH